MRKLKITTKLIFVLGLLSTIIVILASAAISSLIFIETERQIKNEIILKTQQIVNEELDYSTGAIVVRKNDGGASITKVLRESNLSLIIIDTRYKTLARYGIYRNLSEEEIKQFLPEKLGESMNETKTGQYRDIVSVQHGTFDTYSMPLSSQDKIIGFVQVARANILMRLLYTSVIKALLIALPVVWLVTTIIAGWTAKLLLNPLSKFVKQIEGLDAANLPIEISKPINVSIEVETLTNAFNLLLFKVAQVIRREREIVENISHELKTPLTRVGTTIENLLQSLPKKERMKAKDAINEVVTLGRNVDMLLSLPIKGKAINDNYSPVDIQNLISELMGHIDKKIEVRISVPVKTSLKIAEDQIRVVLRNLIENAEKYSSRPGYIYIKVAVDNNNWQISIENPVSKRLVVNKKIFMRRYRKGSVRGYGIGLAIVHSICQQQNWRISLVNKNSNKFVVRIAGVIV